MKGWITINTDAGYYRHEKIGSYAYWIKGDGIFWKGSGVFKEACGSPLECEKKAIANALHILEASGVIVEKIIVNRDNIYASSGRRGDDLSRMMTAIIKRIKIRSIPPTHKNYGANYCEFRHVKAHVKVTNARSYVNDWCHEQCSRELREYKSKYLNNGNRSGASVA